MSTSLQCYGALALEMQAPAARHMLDRDQVDALGAQLARDLQKLLPEVEALDLAFAAAHFDPAELLRPQWPVHAMLSDLAARAPGNGPARTIGFGSAGDAMPAAVLAPDATLDGGPLRLLPFVLQGDAEVAARVGRAMEEQLLERGMADAATALHVQQAFGARLEHVRYLSLHDLCAMTAMQYGHAGLEPLWPLIEATLFGDAGDEWLDAPPEPLLLQRDGEVRIAKLGFEAWRDAGFAPAGADGAVLPRAHTAFMHRCRQFEAVLGAHAIPVRWVEVAAGADARGVIGSGDGA